MYELTGGDEFDPQSLLQTVDGACRALRCGTTKLFELINDGKLKRVKIGTSTRITTASINKYVAQLEQEAA
jgi:excisionase family DNA binding protein